MHLSYSRLACTALFLSTLHHTAWAAPAVNCTAELTRQSALLPTTSLAQFDRTMDNGWRVLANADCFAEAADILQQYIARHGPQSSLFLHLGQIELRQDKRSAAEKSFRLSVRSEEPADAAFRFNDFALALAAYAARDKHNFMQHYAVLADNTGDVRNRMNLTLLSAIREHFEQPYLAVLTALEQQQKAQQPEN